MAGGGLTRMSDLRPEALLGLDNVEVRLPIAPFPLRILAGLLDYFIFGVIIIVIMSIGLFGVVRSGAGSPLWVAVFILGYFVLEYGYFVGLEIMMAGQTPGKRVMGLRVTTRQGGRASSGAILVRNAFRSLDMAIGVPFMIWHPLAQRIGDRLASTLVLETASRTAEAIVRRVPGNWGSKEIAVAEEFLRRSVSMEKIRAQRMAERLLDSIEKESPGFLSPETVVRDPVERLRHELGVTEA